MRLVVFIACAAACGGSVSQGPDAADDVTVADAPFNFGDGFDFGDAGARDSALLDVYVPLDDGGGSFVCDNDVCNGRTQYCDNSSVGPDLGPARCIPLPDGCVPANCECLPNANLGAGCSCERATTGDGLIAGCSLP